MAGTEGQATIRMTDRLLNQIIAIELEESRAVRDVHVRALDGDRLRVQLVLSKHPSFLPPITIDVLIEQQPSLPDAPVLVLKLAGMGGLARFAGPAAAWFDILPQGIRIAGDRVHVDLGALLQQRSLGFVLQHLDELRVNTDEGSVRVGFRARLR